MLLLLLLLLSWAVVVVVKVIAEIILLSDIKFILTNEVFLYKQWKYQAIYRYAKCV
jgi:hypothetical protein